MVSLFATTLLSTGPRVTVLLIFSRHGTIVPVICRRTVPTRPRRRGTDRRFCTNVGRTGVHFRQVADAFLDVR
ncbi:hypothetical protein, partial [Frankia sp. ACN10a]|uniref:hypothetical protein n=1 Tax=Frankia sp. ACN10a TaxID=2926031 RepID=UPI00211779BE